MRKRPLALILASCVFLASPALLILKWFQAEPIASIDWFLSGLLPIALSIGLLKVNRIAWYTLFGFVFLWGVRELQGLQFIIYMISLTYFINPQIKRLYFDPKLQWWRAKRRYETHGPAIIQAGTKTLYPTLKNISEGGCFLETPYSQDQGALISIMIPLPSPIPDSCLKLQGEIRWVSSIPERMGLGIQFIGLSKRDRINLKKFVAQH